MQQNYNLKKRTQDEWNIMVQPATRRCQEREESARNKKGYAVGR